MPKKLSPLHPGEVLREEFLVPLDLSAAALAKAMGVPRTRVERIAADRLASPPTRRFGSGRRLARRRSYGSTCKTGSMWKPRNGQSESSLHAFPG